MYVANHLSSEKLKQPAKQQLQAKLLLRLQAVILDQAGQTAPEIAKILLVPYRPVQYWIQRYNRHGLDGLRDLRRGQDLRQWIRQQFGVLYIYNLLHRLGYRYLKPRSSTIARAG